MTAAKALKMFLEDGPLGVKTTARDMLDFKKACTPAEYIEFGRQACEALGEPYEPPEIAA